MTVKILFYRHSPLCGCRSLDVVVEMSTIVDVKIDATMENCTRGCRNKAVDISTIEVEYVAACIYITYFRMHQYTSDGLHSYVCVYVCLCKMKFQMDFVCLGCLV